MARTIRFSAVILIRGVNPYVAVSASRARDIKPGWRKPLPVVVRINGGPESPWHVNLMPAGDGSFYLYLHGQMRRASGTTVGDRVEVEIQFDADYRGGPAHPMPKELSGFLAAHPKAQAAWETLSPSRQKEVLRYLANLKSVEARARNIVRATRVLSGKNERFMGREWRDGA